MCGVNHLGSQRGEKRSSSSHGRYYIAVREAAPNGSPPGRWAIIAGRAPVLNLLLQSATPKRGRGFFSVFRHLGALGLFFLAVMDSSPLPTFGGPDILIAILAARQINPWYELAAVATAGSVLGAYLTFRLARKAGAAYLHSKFGKRKVGVMLGLFGKWGTGILVASTAIPFPFPTSMVFAAAGASDYEQRKYLAIVTICRATRYTAVAIVADHYGRHFVRMLRHPTQYLGWFLLSIFLVCGLVAVGIFLNKRLANAPATPDGSYSRP